MKTLVKILSGASYFVYAGIISLSMISHLAVDDLAKKQGFKNAWDYYKFIMRMGHKK